MTLLNRFVLVISMLFLVFSSNAADYFWVGGTGDWSDTNSWSATSGVPLAIGTLPTATDNVIFDGASGLAGVGDIVTMDVAVVVNDFDFSAVGNSFTFSSALASIEIQGSLLSNGMPFTWNGDIEMNSLIAGNFILSNGTNWDNDFHIIGTEQVTISDLLSNVADFYVDNGGLLAIGTSLLCNDFYSNTTNTRSIDFSSSSVFINGLNWTIDPTSLTMDMIVSDLNLTNTGSVNFNGGSQAYSNVLSASSSLTVTGDNSFQLASLATSSVLTLENGSQQQMDSLVVSGTCAALTTINSVNPALAVASIEKTGYSVLNSSNLSINNVDGVTGGGQSYNIALSDTTNSNNWTFTGTKYYWINDGGDWSDINHWSFNSGGPAIAGCIPGRQDLVFFDDSSFVTVNDTVFVDVESDFGYMDWSTVTNNPSLKTNTTLHAYGDVVLNPNMTITGTDFGINFNNSSDLTSANAIVDCFMLVNMSDDLDSLTLMDNLTITNDKSLVMQRGEFHTNSYQLIVGAIIAFDLPSIDNKKIQLYNSRVEIIARLSIASGLNEFIFNAGNSHVFVGDTSYDNAIISDMPITFWDLTLDYSSANQFDQVVSGNSFQYNKLEILEGSHIFFDSLSNHTINDSLLIIGNCKDSIYLTSSNTALQAIFNKTTAVDVIAEGIAFNGIEAGNAGLTASFSQDVGNNNTGWTIDNSPPVTSAFTADGPYCFGDTTLFTNQSTVMIGLINDYNMYWTFDDGSPTYNDVTLDSTSHVFNGGGDYDVELVVEYANFCTDTSTISVHINEPTVWIYSAETDQEICEGTLVTFEAGSNAADANFEYFLNGLSQNIPSINDTLFISNSLNHGDSISVTSYENGCITEDTAYMVFTVHDAPEFDWISSDFDTTICSTDSVSFTASSLDPLLEYEFSLNNTIVSNYNTSGFYYTFDIVNDLDLISIVAQDAIGCTDSLEMEFTVHPLPITTLNDGGVGLFICGNELVTFTAAGADTYEFFVDGSPVSGPSALDTWSTTSLSTGEVVSVIGYSTENCEAAALETFSYTVSALPTISLIIDDADTSICSGTDVEFTLTGAAQYQLYINDLPQGPSQFNNTFNLTTISDNDVIYFEGIGGCSNNSDTTTWEVFTSPTTTLTSNNPNGIICDGTEVTFTANGANNYEFLVDGNSQGASSATNVFITSDLNNGETITVEGESNNCFINQSFSFTVLPLPSVNVFSDDPDNIICEGEIVTFTGANASQYDLFINDNQVGSTQTSPIFIPTLTSGLNSIYLIGTAPNGCSDTSSTTIDLTVNPIPNILLSSSEPDNTICNGESVTFTGTGSDMYQFFLDGIPQGSMSITDVYTNTNLVDGQVVTINGSSLGCTSSSNSITTTVNLIPIITFASTDVDNVFCIDHSIDFNASGATNYEFIVDGLSQGTASPISTINSTGFVSGTYDIEVLGESNNCNSNAILTVTVNDSPISDLTSSDDDNTICSGEPITYTGTGGALYEFFINGNIEGSISIVDSIVLSNLLAGDVVSVIVQNANGCQSESTMAPIALNPTPNVVLSSTQVDQAICIGETVTFIGNGSDDYEFFINGISQDPASAVNSFTSSSIADGDIISLIGSSLGCQAAGTDLLFSVFEYPTVTLTNNSDLSLCANELTDLTASGGTSYQFLINGIPDGPFNAASNYNTSLNNGDIVSVIGSLNECETTAISTFTYEVNSYPVIGSNLTPGTTICHDDVVSITATGANEYTFDLNGGILQSGTSTTFNHTGIENGDVINVIGFFGDCPSTPTSYTFSVETMNLNLTSVPSNIICQGENVVFTATGGDQYEFFVNGVSQGAMSATNSFNSSSLLDSDEVTFSAYSNTTSCTQAYGDYMIMFVSLGAAIDPQSSLTFCEGDSVILLSNIPDNNQWFLNGTLIPGATDSAYSVTSSGTYSLESVSGGNGEVWSFGYNAYGNLGNGNNIDSPEPTMANSVELFDELSSGDYFVLGVSLTGDVYSWGDNEFGQLGDGSYTDELSPQLLTGLTDIKSVATTETSSAAVANNGDLYVWGNNDQGQLGTGNTSVINFPLLNSLLNSVDTIAGGHDHFVALKSDGTVWAVGNNDFGQLGQNDVVNSSSPLQVLGLSNIVSIGAGAYSSFAIDNAGMLYVWGNNTNGQLGLNDLDNRLIPTAHTIKRVISAEGGATHSLFLTSDREVFSSGDNTYGQLGNGTTTNSSTPVKMLVNGAIQTSAGEYTSLIRRSDNSVFVSGNNDLDQLSATGTVVTTPELVPDAEGVTFIEGSKSSSHLIFGSGNSCISSPVVATELVAPAVTIDIIDDTLWSTEQGVAYQWYLNEILIPSAINEFHVATYTANYYVEVTYANGCTVTSPTVYHNLVDLVEFENYTLTYYPNPTSDNVNIAITNLLNNKVGLTLIDQMGRIVKTEIKTVSDNLVFDLSEFESGIYYLKVDFDQNQKTLRIVKD